MAWVLWVLLEMIAPADGPVMLDAPVGVFEMGGQQEYVSQEGVKVEGTLIIKEADYPLKHVAVVETDVEKAGADRIHVLVSSKPILKGEAIEKRNDDSPTALTQPSVILTYTRKGKGVRSFAWADNNNIQGYPTAGELRIEEGRLKGFAKLEPKKQRFAFDADTEYDFTFDVPLPEGFTALNEGEADEATVVPVARQATEEMLDDLYPVTAPRTLGRPIAPRDMGSRNGTYTIITSERGIVRMDTRSGEAWLLKVSPNDDASGEWVRIKGPTEAAAPAPPAKIEE